MEIDDDTEDCPSCGEPSGITLGFDVLCEEVSCQHCQRKLKVDYEEIWDGEDESCYFSLVVNSDA